MQVAAAESAQTAKQSQFGGPIPRHLANVGSIVVSGLGASSAVNGSMPFLPRTSTATISSANLLKLRWFGVTRVIGDRLGYSCCVVGIGVEDRASRKPVAQMFKRDPAKAQLLVTAQADIS